MKKQKCRGVTLVRPAKKKDPKQKREKGITLIALVVTIIVLLILAGVSLKLISGNSGILEKADNAVNLTNDATIEEDTHLAIADKMTEYHTNHNDFAGEFSTAMDYVKAHCKGDGIQTNLGATLKYNEETEKFEYTKDGKMVEVTVEEKGNVTIGDETPVAKYKVIYDANGGIGTVPAEAEYTQGATVTVEFPSLTKTGYIFLGWATSSDATSAEYIPSDAGTTFEMRTANVTLHAVWESTISATTGKEVTTKNRTLANATTGYSYKNPVIPQGFKAVDVGTAKWEYTDSSTVSGWNDGLVIQDVNNNNQFVWVPCTINATSDTVTYAKNFSLNSGDSRTASNTSDDWSTAKPSGVTNESDQIVRYQGFYVARYEAGLASATQSTTTNNINNTAPVSVNGTKVWNNINYNNAVAASKLMVDGTSYGNNKSGLITGTQWDTIMTWYKKANIGVEKTTQNWGTYYNYAYSGNGNYFIYTSSVGVWQKGDFSHAKDDTNNIYYHGSGLNPDGIKKNIADIGGNLWEWTAEKYSTKRLYRGGGASMSSSGTPASCRSDSTLDLTIYALGFRSVLYIQ